mmetsp:Transcript_16048/g.38346  ORF Transcript_16048/g.38346 Transcript_16048/m.38346 type:complete len:221 (+) Transcript_16048:319-981(+)
MAAARAADGLEQRASEEVVLQRPPLLRPLRRRRLRMPPVALELGLLLVEARVERAVHQGLGRAAQVGLEHAVEEVHEELLRVVHVSHREEGGALAHDGARREVALPLGGLVLLGEPLELAVHAEAHRAARALPPVLLRAQVVPRRRRVQQALQRAVDEARVADVVQPGARDGPAAIDSDPPLHVRARCKGHPLSAHRRRLWRWAPALAAAADLVPRLPVT